MDLQAILDATDDSSASSAAGGGGGGRLDDNDRHRHPTRNESSKSRQRRRSGGGRNGGTGGSALAARARRMELDLERILRETDDDDEVGGRPHPAASGGRRERDVVAILSDDDSCNDENDESNPYGKGRRRIVRHRQRIPPYDDEEVSLDESDLGSAVGDALDDLDDLNDDHDDDMTRSTISTKYTMPSGGDGGRRAEGRRSSGGGGNKSQRRQNQQQQRQRQEGMYNQYGAPSSNLASALLGDTLMCCATGPTGAGAGAGGAGLTGGIVSDDYYYGGGGGGEQQAKRATTGSGGMGVLDSNPMNTATPVGGGGGKHSRPGGYDDEGEGERRSNTNRDADRGGGAHNPRDWAVLQAILAEHDSDEDAVDRLYRDDDDGGGGDGEGFDDDDEDYDLAVQQQRERERYKRSNSSGLGGGGGVDVDAILSSMNDEDDDIGIDVDVDVDGDFDGVDIDVDDLLEHQRRQEEDDRMRRMRDGRLRGGDDGAGAGADERPQPNVNFPQHNVPFDENLDRAREAGGGGSRRGSRGGGGGSGGTTSHIPYDEQPHNPPPLPPTQRQREYRPRTTVATAAPTATDDHRDDGGSNSAATKPPPSSSSRPPSGAGGASANVAARAAAAAAAAAAASSAAASSNSFTRSQGRQQQQQPRPPLTHRDSFSLEESTSAAAIAHAVSYEKRLLRSTCRDVVSPLQVKRRMKPRREVLTKQRRRMLAGGVGGAGGAGAGAGGDGEDPQQRQNCDDGTADHVSPRFDFAGVLQSKSLNNVHNELVRLQQQQQQQRPPAANNPPTAAAPSPAGSRPPPAAAKTTVNLPTSVAVSTKFIAVGTQTGLILVFDLFEQLRAKLSLDSDNQDGGPASAAAAIAGATPPRVPRRSVRPHHHSSSTTTMAVTSLDISSHGETLTAGYTTGTIVLWDVLTGKPLKLLHDAHPSPITSVRYLPPPDSALASGGKEGTGGGNTVVSVDASGLVNKFAFSRSALLGTLWGGVGGGWTYEVECLLDGTAGQILAIDVLGGLDLVKRDLTKRYYRRRGGGGGAGGAGASTAAATRIGGGGGRDGGRQQPHPVRGMVLLALSSEKSSFVVAVEPTVNVLHRWAKPDAAAASQQQAQPSDSSAVAQNGLGQVSAAGATSTAASGTGHDALPCLAWGWSLVSGGGNTVVPVLARGWGGTVQLLGANFPTLEDDEDDGGAAPVDGGGGAAAAATVWPAFGMQDEFSTDAENTPVVALLWINERSLAYLTLNNEFTVIDTVVMTYLERLDFSPLKLVYAELKFSSRGTGSTFQNSMRGSSCDGRCWILCQQELRSVCLLSQRQLIQDREENGEWLEALAYALDHYENIVGALEDRKRLSRGDMLSRHPEFVRMLRGAGGGAGGGGGAFGGGAGGPLSVGGGASGQLSAAAGGIRGHEDEEWIASLLMRYLKLAVENAPESDGIGGAHPSTFAAGAAASPKIDLATSHFQMLAGVCIEFCIVTQRLDLLFGDIFATFKRRGRQNVFLEVLEPYVLNDKLSYIAPEVMAQFVDYCKASNDIATVERCLLHMDVTIMDFDSILQLLRKNEMYSALLHVFTHGLDDYITPLEILLEGTFEAAERLFGVNSTNDSILSSPRRYDGVFQNSFEKFGYKALVYLQYSLRGKTFPQGKDLHPEDRIATLRPQLLNFLLQPTYAPSVSVSMSKGGGATGAQQRLAAVGRRAAPYPYLHILVLVDAKATLDAFSLVLDAPDVSYARSNAEAFASVEGWEVDLGTNDPAMFAMNRSNHQQHDGTSTTTLCPDPQLLLAILSSIIRPLEDDSGGASRQAQAARGAFLDFVAKYLERRLIRAPKALVLSVIARMSHTPASRLSPTPQARQAAQEKVIRLLQALPPSSYDIDAALPIVEKAGMPRAALLLHKIGASAWGGDVNHSAIGKSASLYDGERHVHHFLRVIDCYLNDDDGDFQRQVFEYIKNECARANILMDAAVKRAEGRYDRDDGDRLKDTFKEALLAKLPALIQLDSVLSSLLAADLFMEDMDHVVDSLTDEKDGAVLFELLRSIISGDLSKADPVAGPVLCANLSMDHRQVYLTLMAKFHPDMVYQHLLSNDNYRADECLKLCQQYDIPDASAYLLERMGNVSSGLQLTLQTLESRLMTLKRIVRGLGTSTYEDFNGDWRYGGAVRGEQDIYGRRVDDRKEREVQKVRQILVVALDLCERNSGPKAASQSEHGSQLWFNVLDRLINAKGFLRLAKELPQHASVMSTILNDLLQLTMQRMVSNVPLPDLVRKITTDHSGSRLGEFREMIMSMLKTYGSELDVCTSAVEVMHQDAKQMSLHRRRLKLQGSEVRCILGQPLGEGKGLNACGLVGNRHSSLLLVDANGNTEVRQGTLHVPITKERGSNEFSSAALSRMQRKRSIRRSCAKQKVHGCVRSSLNHTTSSDQRFASGSNTDVSSFSLRQVGVLPVAEHFGRLGF